MEKKRKSKQIKKSKTNRLPLVIGSFDIIHKGHWNLIKSVLNSDFNILLIINSPKTKTYFNTNEQRSKYLEVLNPKCIYILDVRKNNYTHKDFVNKVLKRIRPSKIIVGSNFRFGRNAAGTIDCLLEDFDVIVMPAKKYRTKDIKNLYLHARVDEANSQVVLPILYEGKVVKGKQFGRTYGYPTLNQIFKDKNLIVPKNGIYASHVYIDSHVYNAATYIKKSQKTLIESYVINKKLPFNMYGKNIKVRLLKYIKPTSKIKAGDHKKYVANMVGLVKNYFKK